MAKMSQAARKKQILRVLRQLGDATIYRLANTTGLSVSTVRNYLKLLEEDNLVEFDEVEGVWRVKGGRNGS